VSAGPRSYDVARRIGTEAAKCREDANIVDWLIVEVLIIIFVATLIRSAFGFGEALVAVPLLALLIPVEVAAPLAVLVSITVAALVLARDWRHVQTRSAAWLIGSTAIGIPFGLLLLTRVPESLVKGLLAAVVAGFSIWSLGGGPRRALADDRLAWLFGIGAGVLGGAYGMNGPPLIAYGTLRGWSPGEFRATLQGYFLPASLMGMAGYWTAGLWRPRVNELYLHSLPAVVAAVILGHLIHRRLNAPRFLAIVHGCLLLVAAMLALEAVGLLPA
jgi:uncharacterized membrane protein YfcA